MKIDFRKLPLRQLKLATKVYKERRKEMAKHIKSGQQSSRKHNGHPFKWSDKEHINTLKHAEKLLKRGESMSKISQVTGIPRPTLYRYRRRMNENNESTKK